MADQQVILFLAANPGGMDRPGLDREAHAIRDELERGGHRDQFVFETLLAAEPLDLLRALRKIRPAVVHYCGSGEESGLHFQAADGRAAVVPARAFAEAFRVAGASVRLVVLSACYSDEHASALLDHVECIVGMVGSIHPDAARSFSVGFYGGLSDGASIHEAFQHGRAAISLEHDRPAATAPDGEAQTSGIDARLPQLKTRTGIDATRLVLAHPVVPPLPAVPDIGSAPSTAVPVFIAYAAEDRIHHVALETLLAPFARNGALVVIGRREIDGRSPFDDAPHQRAAEARLVVLCVSKHLLYADYLNRASEIQQARERHAHGSALVVSVRFGSAAIEATWLAGHPAIPADGSPILESEDPEPGLLRAAKHIGRLAASLGRDESNDAIPERHFFRNAYLSSLLRRLRVIDEDGRASFVEPRKQIVDSAYDRAFELSSIDPDHESSGPSEPKIRPTRTTKRSLMRLFDQVQTARVTALLGDPGSGKSLLLLELADALARRAIEDPNAPIPVHVKLGSFVAPLDDDKAFERFVVDYIAAGPPEELSLAPELPRLQEQGRVVLLCDGLDELPRVDFRARVQQVSEFARTHERCRVVFACRSNDFPPELDLQRIVIAPFGTAEMTAYLARALGKSRSEAQALTRVLGSPESSLNVVATRPFFLAVIARYIKKRERIPHEKREVFEDLLERPRMVRMLASYSAVERAEFDEGLNSLAAAMLDLGGVGTAVSPVPLIAQLAKEIGRDAAATLVDLCVTAGLLERDREGAVRFFHPLIQEFLLSRAIAAMPEARREAWLLDHVDDPWLREIYVFVAQQRVRLDGLVGAICAASAAVVSHSQPADPAERIGRDWELMRHELRLVLVGRLIEAGARIEPDQYGPLAAVLADLDAGAHQRLGPRTVVARVLRAIRGPIVLEPRARRVVVARLRGPTTEHSGDALIALASQATTHVAREHISKEIHRQALITNYAFRFLAYYRIALRDARCMFLRRAVVQALVIYIALCFLGGGIILASGYRTPLDAAFLETCVPSNVAYADFLYVLLLVAHDVPGAGSFLRTMPAAVVLNATAFATVVSTEELVAWLGPNVVAAPCGWTDLARDMAFAFDVIRWCAPMAAIMVALVAHLPNNKRRTVSLTDSISWGVALGLGLVFVRGCYSLLPAWLYWQLAVAVGVPLIFALVRDVIRWVRKRERAAKKGGLLTRLRGALIEIHDRWIAEHVPVPAQAHRRMFITVRVLGIGFFLATVARNVLRPAGGITAILGLTIEYLFDLAFWAAIVFVLWIVLRRFIVLNIRSVRFTKGVPNVEGVVGALNLLASPFVLPELRREIAELMARMCPPSSVIAVFLQSLLLDEFTEMARLSPKRNKSTKPELWKHRGILEKAVDTLQNRLEREDAAAVDDELRVLETIRATFPEKHWRTVCGAWARLASTHHEALIRHAAAHASAREVIMQMREDVEPGAEP